MHSPYEFVGKNKEDFVEEVIDFFQEVYSTSQISDKLNIHVETVTKHIRENKIPAVKIGNSYFVDRTFIDSKVKGTKWTTE